MLAPEERMKYWQAVEAARDACLADPEVAIEYHLASQAWDSAIQPSPVPPRSNDRKRPSPSTRSNPS